MKLIKVEPDPSTTLYIFPSGIKPTYTPSWSKEPWFYVIEEVDSQTKYYNMSLSQFQEKDWDVWPELLEEMRDLAISERQLGYSQWSDKGVFKWEEYETKTLPNVTLPNGSHWTMCWGDHKLKLQNCEGGKQYTTKTSNVCEACREFETWVYDNHPEWLVKK